MPHEVIMPALGMAQETGLIVAWLKRPGDAVKTGDPLMEVETDKATMEVEAAADGFLTNLRAGEGDNVPVGGVVAMISETADDPGDDDTPGTEDTPEPAPKAAPAGREVIMPALGMAQDTGKIVAWLKEPGAAVAEGDALLEVETDKATMEVEADTAGFLAAVYAGEGDDVPVGQVIAVISAEKPDAPVVGIATPPSKADERPSPKATLPAKVDEHPVAEMMTSEKGETWAAEPAVSAVDPTGRILASPKAKRLAAERGLDLGRLAKAGHPQPYHVADLDTFATLREPAVATVAGPATHRIEARVPRDGLDAFADWLSETGDTTPRAAVLAALVTGALRAATQAETIAVRLDRPGRPSDTYDDADLAAPQARSGDGPDPALVLRDLTGTRLTAMHLGAAPAPVLTVAASGGELIATLDLSPGQIDQDTAVALIDGFAARLEDPLRQLF